ncbi:hypothetical protein BJN12_07645 [Listeria monocytogenes]|uniref:hypothetical protein n=1 Tax=Listeria monocytogenes TaxID=1639 RepID=UPI000873AEA7|nr:hypothetical protein [Listeria monocytogenes]EAG7023121.1 hypothetical protein [Listeria monocytogenes]EAG9445388.1 hypothetical protein [Listeria monocytogenes]OFH62368.1 hypothetical protein BJN12_07645 [Listeria monocytogenes]
MRKLDFSYNNANYNAEFLMKILTTLKDITKVEQFTIEIIDAVPNDQEQFKEEKGLFSIEVFDFNNLVKESHGIKIDFKEITNVLKQCRTVWELSMLVVTSENELNDSGKVLCEVELIEGDLFAILYSEDFNIDLFLEKFSTDEITIEG